MAWFGAKKSVPGLVLRRNEVQLLGLQSKTVTCRVRVPFKADEEGSLADSIRQAMEMAGLQSAKLPVSIQSTDILFRFFSIPAVPKAECDTAVQFEARRYIPFKIESLLWDYKAVPSPANPKRLDVIFAAMPREAFGRVQEALTAAGVQPTRIEPTHVSLARLVELSAAAGGGEFVCIVDVDDEAAHLAIVRRRMPHLTRDISLLPSPEMPPSAEQSSAAAGLDVGTPLSLLEPQPVLDLDPQAKRLLSELSVSMDFFMREYPSTTIARVWLCGDESRIGPWCGWLAEQLRCPVQLARPLVQPLAPDDVPLSFASAIGVVAGASESGEGSIDLLRGATKAAMPLRAAAAPGAASVGALQDQVLALLKTPRTVIAACVALGLIAGLWVLELMWVGQARRELAQLHVTQIAPELGLDQMAQEQLDSVKQRLDLQVATIKRIIEQRASVAAKLDGLARSLPDGVWITGFELDNELKATGEGEPHLTLNGACYLGEAAQELGAIQRFESQLRQHEQFFKGFASAQLEEIVVQTSQEPRYRTFLLNCASRRRM